MSYQKNLPVPYHQQDTQYYCGAACAQMVFATPKVGLGLLGQDGLYIDNHNHSRDETHLTPPVDWKTAPDGLAWTLNDRAPQYFVEYALSSEDAISRKIAWTIEHYEVPPCALVMGARHWIAVRGMDVSKAPTSSTDVGYAINSFRINDPWPYVPSWNEFTNTRDPALVPPPPHSNTDNCGNGWNRGVPDQVISYTQWKNTYMTGANYNALGYWQGKFVAVCDPEPPSTRRGFSNPRLFRFDGEQLITDENVIQLAMETIKKKILPQDEIWTKSMEGVKPEGTIMVQRLDRIDEYYYIIPLARNSRGATAALTYDARFGDFQQAISFSRQEPRILQPLTTKEVMNKFVGKTLNLGKRVRPLRFREGVTTVLEHWVWKPCLESLSPFWPFKMVFNGTNIVYVRIDGQVFPTLNEDVYGI